MQYHPENNPKEDLDATIPAVYARRSVQSLRSRPGAAEAAGAQHKFWPMHDLLFEHQQHLKAISLRQYALQAELDLDRYDYEINEHVYLQRVHEHIDGGAKSGVRSTPGFFVNGAVQDVSFGFERLYAAVEAALGE